MLHTCGVGVQNDLLWGEAFSVETTGKKKVAAPAIIGGKYTLWGRQHAS